MNKKGFTTVELILTMTLVIIIMATITSVTYVYRDKSKYEEISTDITNYKNTVTKIIYDDILDIGSTNGKVNQLEKVSDVSYNFITTTNKIYNLKILNSGSEIGIEYDGIKYIVPGSNDGLVKYLGVSLYPNPDDGITDSSIYSLDIYFSHKVLDKQFKIHLIVSK